VTPLHDTDTEPPADTVPGLTVKVAGGGGLLAVTVTEFDVARRFKVLLVNRRSSYVPVVVGIVYEQDPDASAVLPAVVVQLSS